MSGYWQHRTNHGRVVYDRPLNTFKERDIQRIVDRWTASQEPGPLMMSTIADKVMFFIARRFALDEIAVWASERLVWLFDSLRGNLAPRSPENPTPEELALLEWMKIRAGQVAPGAPPRAAALTRIRGQCTGTVEWIDSELNAEGA
jgi:hypothetical protein